MRVWVGGRNRNARREVERHLKDTGTSRPPTGPIHLAFITPKSTDEAVYFVRKLLSRLSTDGIAWVVYPTETSPRRAELEGSPAELIAAMGGLPVVEAETAPVGDGYTSTGFRRD